MPVQLATTSATSSASTSSLSIRLSLLDLLQLAVFLFQFLVQLDEFPVADLRGPGKVARALGVLLLGLEGLDPAFDCLNLFDGLFFTCPVHLHLVHRRPKFGEFLVDLITSFHGGPVRFLFQRLPFDLELDDTAIEGIDFRGQAVQLDPQARSGLIDQDRPPYPAGTGR